MRALGRELGLPEHSSAATRSPGPGLAVRILGEVTRGAARRSCARPTPSISTRSARPGLYDAIWQAFAVLLPVRTVGVMGDARTYDHVCALRAVDLDGRHDRRLLRLPPRRCSAASRPASSTRCSGINRVVYDVTSKPPGDDRVGVGPARCRSRMADRLRGRRDERTMSGRLAGKITVISGGATGMGGAPSKLFAAEGAKIGVVDRNEEAGRAVVTEIKAAGGTAVFASRRRRRRLGQCCGCSYHHGARRAQCAVQSRRLHHHQALPRDHARRSGNGWMAVNVTSMFLGGPRAVLPGDDLGRGRGDHLHVVDLAVAATPNEVALNASKGACHMFARAIAVEYQRPQHPLQRRLSGVRAYPARLARGCRSQQAWRRHVGCGPCRSAGPHSSRRRWRSAPLFLASDEASFINGAHLFVDNCFLLCKAAHARAKCRTSRTAADLKRRYRV